MRVKKRDKRISSVTSSKTDACNKKYGITNKTEYSRMDQAKFVEDSINEICRDIVCLNKPYPSKFFKGRLPQFLLAPFLNTLSQITFYQQV